METNRSTVAEENKPRLMFLNLFAKHPDGEWHCTCGVHSRELVPHICGLDATKKADA